MIFFIIDFDFLYYCGLTNERMLQQVLNDNLSLFQFEINIWIFRVQSPHKRTDMNCKKFKQFKWHCHCRIMLRFRHFVKIFPEIFLKKFL